MCCKRCRRNCNIILVNCNIKQLESLLGETADRRRRPSQVASAGLVCSVYRSAVSRRGSAGVAGVCFPWLSASEGQGANRSHANGCRGLNRTSCTVEPAGPVIAFMTSCSPTPSTDCPLMARITSPTATCTDLASKTHIETNQRRVHKHIKAACISTSRPGRATWCRMQGTMPQCHQADGSTASHLAAGMRRPALGDLFDQVHLLVVLLRELALLDEDT